MINIEECGGHKYVSKIYIYNGNEINVKVKCFENNVNQVYSDQYRDEEELFLNNLSSIHILCSVDYFFEDMDFLFQQMENKQLDKQSLWDSLCQLIINHINKYGRLVDSDFEGYLDRVFKMLVAITESTNNGRLSDSEGRSLRVEFKDAILKFFKDFIWITSGNPFNLHEKPKLVKFTDLIKS